MGAHKTMTHTYKWAVATLRPNGRNEIPADGPGEAKEIKERILRLDPGLDPLIIRY